jgi:hypothetical protein
LFLFISWGCTLANKAFSFLFFSFFFCFERVTFIGPSQKNLKHQALPQNRSIKVLPFQVQLWAKHVNKKCVALGTFWELHGNKVGTLWVQQKKKTKSVSGVIVLLYFYFFI